MGKIEVSFSQKMERPKNITEIHVENALQLSLIIDDSNIISDNDKDYENDFGFSWIVESFQETLMTI